MENKVKFWRDQFYQFLVENGALFTFLKYTTFEKAEVYLKEMLCKPYEYLQYKPIFDWHMTDEGEFYWDQLNKKWGEKIYTIQNENRTKMGGVK